MNDPSRASSTPSMNEDRNTSPNMNTCYQTPFVLIVGPQQQEAMVHKEMLSTKSPYITRLSQKTSAITSQHGTVIDIHRRLKAAADGPAANLTRPMVDAIRYALLNVPQRHYDTLERSIHESMQKNCRCQAAGSLALPKDVEFVTWACGKLMILASVQVVKVVESAQSSMFRIIRKGEKSDDPDVAAGFNRLYLQNSTLDAVQMMMPYLYTDKLPVVSGKDIDSLMTICHLHALAAHFEMYELANHCMNCLASLHNLFVDPSTANRILEQARTPENLRSWTKIARLVFDILAATDSPYFTDDQVGGMVSVTKSLDAPAARYVAAASMQRTRTLMQQTLCSKVYDAVSLIPPTLDIKTEDPNSNVREDSALPAVSNTYICAAPFTAPVSICETYHWHFPGEGCFPETKRPEEHSVSVGERESHAQEIENNSVTVSAPSSEATSPAVEKAAGKKRKADSEADEDYKE